MQRYEHLTRDELMHLALDRDQLTEEAQLALDTEVSNRRISSMDLVSFRAESLAAKAEQDRQIGPIAHRFNPSEKNLLPISPLVLFQDAIHV